MAGFILKTESKFDVYWIGVVKLSSVIKIMIFLRSNENLKCSEIIDMFVSANIFRPVPSQETRNGFGTEIGFRGLVHSIYMIYYMLYVILAMIYTIKKH